MGNPEIVFVGTHTFTFTLPSSAEEAVRWVLCFPVRRLKTRYAPQTKAVMPDGEDVFYTFSSVVTNDPSQNVHSGCPRPGQPQISVPTARGQAGGDSCQRLGLGRRAEYRLYSLAGRS